MSARLFLPMPGNEAMARLLSGDGDVLSIALHRFPDGETLVRLPDGVKGRAVAIVASLDRPDAKFLPLVFAADAARDLGAASVGLVAPYLCYMRQDRRFEAGEAVTSRSFARLVSQGFDWLVTVDPHLHRIASLGDIYTIPAKAVHAASLLARWVKANVRNPFLVGPDAESLQWVAQAAREIGAPCGVLKKLRHGDRDVEVCLAEPMALGNHTPVLLDDIVSSGQTLVQAARALRRAGAAETVAVVVHALCDDEAARAIALAGVRLVSSNSVSHSSNAIDMSPLLAEAIAAFAD